MSDFKIEWIDRGRERDMIYERALRDAGRGHLLGDYPSPLERADIERKRQREEPDTPTPPRAASEDAE